MAWLLLPVLLLLCTTFHTTTAVSSSKSFPIHRAVQFNLDHEKHGSRVSTLELKALGNPGIQVPKPSTKKGKKPRRLQPLNRKCIVITMKEATQDLVEHLVDARRVGGLLIVIPNPKALDSNVEPQLLANWATLEQWILSRELKVPIFFTIASDDTASIVDFVQAKKSSSGSDNYLLKANLKPSKKIKSPSLQNIQGWLAGESKEVDSEHLPTIAIVGHYDSFGVIPSLAKDRGTSAVAVLELARMFAKTYKKQKGNYNMLFVLTAGKHMNFAGLRDWLEQLDVQLMDSIDFAICLDDLSLNEGNQLYLHYSKNPQDLTLKRIVSAIETAATKKKGGSGDIQIVKQRKKIQLTKPHLAWQHEQFAMKRIVGVTLSSRSEPSLFSKAHHHYSFSSAASASASNTRLAEAITLIGHALTDIIYPVRTVTEEVEVEVEDTEEEEKEEGKENDDDDTKKRRKKKKTKLKRIQKKVQAKRMTNKVDVTHVATWTAYMQDHARVAPFMSTANAMDLEKGMKIFVRDTSVQKFILEETDVQNFVFYDSIEGTMSAYIVKGIEFDLKMTLFIGVYLGAIWFYMLVLKHGWKRAKSKVMGGGASGSGSGKKYR